MRDLSSEHHQGLVLARRARRAAEGAPDAEAAWEAVQARFRDALEPHFRAEEDDLLPALMAAGGEALVSRTGEEHAALRACIARPGSEARAALAEFARLLEAHIRFEERELFPAIQRRVLDADG